MSLMPATEAQSEDKLPLLLMPATEAQRVLGGYSRRGLHDLIKKRGLPAVKIGSRLMFCPADLAAWVEQQKQPAPPILAIHQPATNTPCPD